eukprot:600664-Heterocapsa_arctica.AAC.1
MRMLDHCRSGSSFVEKHVAIRAIVWTRIQCTMGARPRPMDHLVDKLVRCGTGRCSPTCP